MARDMVRRVRKNTQELFRSDKQALARIVILFQRGDHKGNDTIYGL